MSTMNIKQTKDAIRNFPTDISILISGNHGIGKSAIVKQVATDLGIPCVDFRLSQNDVGDLKGMPFHIKGRTVFAPPEFFPLKGEDAKILKDLLGLAEDISLGLYGDKGILFLDEINRANREVQQAAFELVLDRRLNLRALPEGWRVVSAINGDDDIYTVNAMEPAFLSRFALIELKPTYQEWFGWAENEGHIHDSIIQFLKKNPEFLDPSKELLLEAQKKGVCKVHDRRAWEKFSSTMCKYLKDYEDGLRDVNMLSKTEAGYEELILIGGSFVGNMASLKFKTFIEMDYNSMDANVILNQWDESVEKRLEEIVAKGRIPELEQYNSLILEYIEKTIKGNLNDKQKHNLANYTRVIPKEVVADLWQKFIHDQHDVAQNWYLSVMKFDKTNPIMSALVCPTAKTK